MRSGGSNVQPGETALSVLSSSEMRVATSLMVAFRARRARGSPGRYEHSWPPRAHGVQGERLSQRTLRRRHVAHDSWALRTDVSEGDWLDIVARRPGLHRHGHRDGVGEEARKPTKYEYE